MRGSPPTIIWFGSRSMRAAITPAHRVTLSWRVARAILRCREGVASWSDLTMDVRVLGANNLVPARQRLDWIWRAPTTAVKAWHAPDQAAGGSSVLLYQVGFNSCI